MVKTHAGVMTVTRGQYIGLPMCENTEGKPLTTLVRQAIDSRAIVGNHLGHHELIATWKNDWNGEVRDVEIHAFPHAVIVTLIHSACWIPVESDDSRLDAITRKALEVLRNVGEPVAQVA